MGKGNAHRGVPGLTGLAGGFLRSGLAAILVAAAVIAPSLKAQSPPTNATGKCPQQIQDARHALSEAPSEPRTTLQLARSLAACHQDEEAITWYRKYVQMRPYDYRIWYELGTLQLRRHDPAQAAAAFRRDLTLEPEDAGGELGLAQALSAAGRFAEALDFYNKVLAQQPSNYDALQGKAFVLHWTRRDAEAQPIFERLLRMNPADEENRTALRQIAHSDAARWERLRPPPGSWAGAFVSYYISYLADHPNDEQARWQLAAAQARLKDYSGAIETYRTILRKNPADDEARGQLARVLAWNHQYDASIRALRGLVARHPKSQQWLEQLATVYNWAGREDDALSIERRLQKLDPQNISYAEESARLEFRLGKTDEAAQTLSGILKEHPGNRWSRLELARLDSRDGRFRESLENYQDLLGADFQDPDALYGAAQVNYYLGRFNRAYPLASHLVQQRPHDYDALMLLARIERARRHRSAALELLARASRLNPSAPQPGQLSEQIGTEHTVTVHTSASYARELGYERPFFAPADATRLVEDLNTYGSEARISFPLLPRSQSYVTLASMPSNSPIGGIQGAVAPAQMMYSQTTPLGKALTLRGGAGLVRLGPGPVFGVVSEQVSARTPSLAGIGFGGFSLFPARKLNFDFTVSRSAIAYTPLSVRFGVMRTRFALGVNLTPDSRTNLRLEYDHDRDSSSVYIDRFLQLRTKGIDIGDSGSIDFGRTLLRYEHFSFTAGYSGRIFGYSGGRRGIYMGFFNPAFYQYHALALNAEGRLAGPVSYSMLADVGGQQLGRGEPFTRALKLGPGLRFRINRRLSIAVGYVHYNFAQSLGSVRGNAVALTTDWGL